MHLRKKK